MDNKIEAGEFSLWVEQFLLTMKAQSSGDVPCGQCVGCCTSSKFIHLKPTDTAALKVIPQQLLFSAPGLPEGHFVLGYDEKGHCPMFVNGGCSIYEQRPETCRQYDCRVLSATGAPTTGESDVIANRIAAWEFQYSSQASIAAKEAIELAADFLQSHRASFPEGYLPPLTPQLSALAIRIHSEFVGLSFESTQQRAEQLVTTITQNY